MYNYKPVALVILDGWGFRDAIEGNAVVQAKTPNLDHYRMQYEQSLLQASGEAVGLTADQMGNSEVGHLNIGAGRVVYQDIARIDRSIRTQEFFNIEPLTESLQHIQQSGKKLHLLGLFGPGGVHSHTRHLHALIQMAEKFGIKPILHIITDGRDTPPNSAIHFAEKLESFLQHHPAAIGTLSGRYYAMDRDKRWDRTKKAFDAYVHQQGQFSQSLQEAIKESYAKEIYDEFILPTIISSDSQINTKIESGDTLLFYNFRADRMRQIVKSFSQDDFAEFDRGVFSPDHQILTFTEYDPAFSVKVIFPKDHVNMPLAEVISLNGLTQFHAAETEKYAHVTFFLNGGREQPFPGEERLLIPSPKVPTYDLQPEMSAFALTEGVLERIENYNDDLIILNYANLDMVGHTGVLEAGIRAAETVDTCVGKIVEAVRRKNGIVLITADHGNAELMYDHLLQQPHTYHTTNLVQFHILSDQYFRLRPSGSLQDIAPTILNLLNLPVPEVMTGRNLIEEAG